MAKTILLSKETLGGFDPKYWYTAQFIRSRSITSVLDVGCRDGILHEAIRAKGIDQENFRYSGVDLSQNETNTVEYVCDVTSGIPVEAASYDLVVALDLLEHLDDFQAGLDELDRVARRYIIVSLPNMAHFFFRFKFLLTGQLGGKYMLRYGYGPDRHRWVTVLPQTDAYFTAYSRERGYTLEPLHLSHGGRRLPHIEWALRLVGFPPTWYTWLALYVIEKPPILANRSS